MLSLTFGRIHNYTDKAPKVWPLSWNIMSKLSQNKTVAEAKDKKQNKLLQVNTRQSETLGDSNQDQEHFPYTLS